ncbi:hypothetical protein [Halostella pelagica]|uniref:hypothetical protein n=1 Tax=Halostella pelagica TaxID=2583824 RepID=UPI001081DBA8|nr:hypothetical protein [Halostella pelagica]
MSEALTVEWSGEHCRRRMRFERRSAGGWKRVEERRKEGAWRFVGSEIVAGLVVEGGTGDATGRVAEVFRGP